METRNWLDRLLLVGLIIWTLFTVIEDTLAGWDIYRQIRSLEYPQT